MRRLEILQHHDFTVGLQFLANAECLLWQSIRRRCRNVQTQNRTVVWLCHARLGVFVGQHCGARGVQIGVVVRVVEMPVRVDHRLQRRIAQPSSVSFNFGQAGIRNVSTTILPSGPFNTTTFLQARKATLDCRQRLRLDRRTTHLRPHRARWSVEAVAACCRRSGTPALRRLAGNSWAAGRFPRTPQNCATFRAVNFAFPKTSGSFSFRLSNVNYPLVVFRVLPRTLAGFRLFR